jgi:tetratricopeptide (TPR) repeat protein
MKPCWSFFLAVLFCQSAGLSAQSLAEVARRERERRKGLDEPKAVETDVDPKRLGTTVSARPRQTAAPVETVSVLKPPDVLPVSFTASEPGTTAGVAPVSRSREEDLERGYALLGSSQRADAAGVFRELLRKAPLDRDARLGLARVYARSGHDGAAREEFESLLASNPSDVEAILGIAQTYQWSGVGPMARERYEEALAIEPGLEEAEIGLAQIELWREPALAAERLVDLSYRFPESANVRILREEAEKARAPQFHVSYDRLTDTGQNELAFAWIESRLGLSSRWDLRMGGALYEMTFDGEDLYGARGSGSIQSVYTVMGRPTAPGQRVDLRVGLDHRKDTRGATDLVAIGGAAWSWGLDRKWSGRLAFDRDSFRYTTQALDDGIVVNALTASLSRQIATSWLVDGELGYWDIDDELGIGNRRLGAEGGLRFKRLLRRTTPFEAGYSFQSFSYEKDFGASFFSPSFYRAHRFQAGVGGPMGSALDYHVSGSAGIQSYDRVSNEPMWTLLGTLGVALGGGYRFEVFGSRGDFLILSDFPVTSEQFGFRVRWQGGGVH